MRLPQGDRYDSVDVHGPCGLMTFSQTESSAGSEIFCLRIHNSVSGKISFANFFLGKKLAQSNNLEGVTAARKVVKSDGWAVGWFSFGYVLLE
jgi:hypothetical protein